MVIVNVNALISQLKAAILVRDTYPDPEQANDNRLLKQSLQCIEELYYLKIALLQDNKECYEKLVKIWDLCEGSFLAGFIIESHLANEVEQ